ncbi:hypothetical protein N7462_005135 [Penicillium macrosclerotiorum]|uniref:uncharacterized protein n=1 Tax=Penicillium macrosclerotiorum TaxID=303699 RepID=UPI0025474BA7|nr:uncharacterized protein N7462_005135 [Penicillium macrosclerotiorum]KAJ5690743.1 hypothetical protein N7462_005135 [Penicillium macrosclerotiorum]
MSHGLSAIVESRLWDSNVTLFRIKQHLFTLWLFTVTDIETVILPCTVLGISNILAQSPVILDEWLHIFKRTLTVVIWLWVNLVPLTISNQRGPASILEDSANKPWRPLPSRRITPHQAKRVMLAFYVVSQIYSRMYSGGGLQSFGLAILGTWYNRFEGGEHHPLLRNFINALGYLCFTSGVVEIALGDTKHQHHRSLDSGEYIGHMDSPKLWPAVITGIIVSTMHIQDMYDQEGDALRGRKTLPLVIGDKATRRSLAIAMVLWGIICPILAQVEDLVFLASCLLTFSIAFRTLTWRDPASDKITYRVWNIWASLVFIMPLLGVQKQPTT